MDQISFEGRVAIVTGAGGGLGRSYAIELARRGARVLANDLGTSPDGIGGASSPADATVEAIVAAGGEAVASYDSVATQEGGEAIVQAAVDAFGAVDVVINNAGTLRDSSFVNLTHDDLQAIIDVHLLGAFHVTQPAFRLMKAQGYGRLLFTTSSAGVFGNFGQSNYGAAKMGLVGLSNVLSVEGAKYGITSNVIAPLARSRLTEEVMGRLVEHLEPGLVTPLALFLVSEANESTHGLYSVGGGRYSRIFIGLTPGWVSERSSSPTLEDVAEHFAEIADETGYIVPSSIVDEMKIVRELLR